ncbi:MAG: hypothetical protein HRU76_00435 [Phycisphaeraceae bacterium]|nr:MAG: hypothetical protein HRU76_00435 [Phycisphaeraceae bacterium]
MSLPVPRAELKFHGVLGIFARELASEPAMYHIAPDRAADLLHRLETYEAALHRARSAATRTTPAIAAKNAARKAAMQALRQLINTIAADPRIEPAVKMRLGFKVAKHGR